MGEQSAQKCDLFAMSSLAFAISTSMTLQDLIETSSRSVSGPTRIKLAAMVLYGLL